MTAERLAHSSIGCPSTVYDHHAVPAHLAHDALHDGQWVGVRDLGDHARVGPGKEQGTRGRTSSVNTVLRKQGSFCIVWGRGVFKLHASLPLLGPLQHQPLEHLPYTTTRL